ncbi:NAD-dependent epimerase/dehydratase family protein [Tunicatimonas pelagia]|uniref:NAD-dependent epimerase/dehydratase family protein n=1 Tax=Tunicatimonas pelagia TaxID=931531 RepID=UPI002665B820|nr:NAD-dependent epimerase/dehydratase family protein [Tunicatimonas pelagia]WKN44187.1 NAD-dependent epimerase/dehydratase family protein [Tunicatimonas pelagia]
MKKNSILITGASGQLGSVLVEAIIGIYGSNSVIATDIKPIENSNCHTKLLDATDQEAIVQIILKHNVTEIYHLAAVLSANGEAHPTRTWDVNMVSWLNVLEASRRCQVQKVFFPSSIAVYGGQFERENTPQNSALNPATVYGMSKVSGEQWGQYYFSRYGLDVRSLRYPGIISYQSLPGGGTTDYAVDIYHKAVSQTSFNCYLKPDTKLPMIYVDDAVRATLELMHFPEASVKTRASYNIQGVSFTPEDVVASIQLWYPGFTASYQPDFRQAIADQWPSSLDDREARTDWHWKPKYTLKKISRKMIGNLKALKNASIKNEDYVTL